MHHLFDVVDTDDFAKLEWVVWAVSVTQLFMVGGKSRAGEETGSETPHCT